MPPPPRPPSGGGGGRPRSSSGTGRRPSSSSSPSFSSPASILLRPRTLLAAFTLYCLLARRSPIAGAGDCLGGLRAGLAGLASGLAAAGASAASPPDAGDDLAVAIRNATSDYAEVREKKKRSHVTGRAHARPVVPRTGARSPRPRACGDTASPG